MEKDKNEKEPEWITNLAKGLLKQPKESNGDEDQNNIMELINNNEDDQL